MKELCLLAEVRDEDLLFSLVHELGATFWRQCEDGSVEVVYYSGNKIVHYLGKLSKEHQKTLEQNAWRVQTLEIDETSGFVRITQ